MNFTLLDWCIIVVYLAATISAGLYAKRFVSDLSGYIVAGRTLKLGACTATMIATEIGTVTFMYMGEGGYRDGFSAMILGVIMLAVYFAVGRSGFIIAGLRKLRVHDYTGILHPAVQPFCPHPRRFCAVHGRHPEHGRVPQAGWGFSQ